MQFEKFAILQFPVHDNDNAFFQIMDFGVLELKNSIYVIYFCKFQDIFDIEQK